MLTLGAALRKSGLASEAIIDLMHFWKHIWGIPQLLGFHPGSFLCNSGIPSEHAQTSFPHSSVLISRICPCFSLNNFDMVKSELWTRLLGWNILTTLVSSCLELGSTVSLFPILSSPSLLSVKRSLSAWSWGLAMHEKACFCKGNLPPKRILCCGKTCQLIPESAPP